MSPARPGIGHRWTGLSGTLDRLFVVVLGISISISASSQMAGADAHQQSATSNTPGTIAHDSTMIIGNGTTGPYWVSGYFIISGSESIGSGRGNAIDSSQYTLDIDHGYLTLRDSLASGDTLFIRYQRLAFALATEWTTSDNTSSPKTNTTTPLVQNIAALDYPMTPRGPASSRTRPTGGTGQSLEWQGFKSFSVTTSSNRSSDWSQGLELSLEGEIADGVRVRGAISDRFANSLSNRSRGPVTRVGDLDRMFLEAQSQRFYGRFGQVSLPSLTTRQPQRQAAGARFAWTGDAHAVDGYVGRATGTPVRHRLTTQPQIAGPYKLSANGTYGEVLPASVIVTKDGERLTEGAEADYTFDIATGAITFAPDAVPDAGSIVIVEYERALDAYRRTLAGASWTTGQSDSRFQNNVTANWEADNPGQPLFGELSDEQRSVLSQSTDGSVAVPAYEYHGNNDGDYDLNLTANGDTVFTYVGPGNGDWRVSFEYVGAGQGRYRHLAEDAFEYVGEGDGSYEAVTTLGAPRAFMTVSESVHLSKTALGSFDAQWHGFIDDPNRFAANNTQVKSNHHLGWSTGGASNNHKADRLHLDWWRQEAISERTRAVDDFGRFSNAWQLRESLFDESRNEYQVRASSSSERALHATVESGVMTAPSLDALRWSVATTAQPTTHLTTQAGWAQRIGQSTDHNTNDHDSWRELSTSVDYIHGSWSLNSQWSQRDLTNEQHTFTRGPLYVSKKTVGLGYTSAQLEYQWIDSYDSLDARHRTRELSFSTPLDVAPSLDGRMLVARGEQSFASGEFAPYYRGRLDGGWHPHPNAAINAQMDLAYTRSGLEQEVYLPTRPGQGQYRLERGEYVPDAHGDYRRVVSRTNQTGSASYEGRQTIFGHWRPTVAGWRWALELRRDRLARHDPNQFAALTWLAPWTAYTWNPAAGARAERHDFHRLTARPNNRTEMSVDWTSDRTVFGLDRVHNNRDRFGSVIRHDLSNHLYVEAGGDLEMRERSGGIGLAVDAEATTMRFTVGGTPQTMITWSLEGRRRTDDDRVSNVNVRLLGVRPRAQAGFGAITLLVESDLT
ncbi:MAG: hypothetical protein GF341_07480, partial [candidate division Zixibacteria bacterium]|nr:hypothetical protein [candidate division Zixibacteria bacterium]